MNNIRTMTEGDRESMRNKLRPKPELQNNLRKYREVLGLRLEHIALEFNCSTTTIDRWERGITKPEAIQLSQISLIYQQPINVLLPYLGL